MIWGTAANRATCTYFQSPARTEVPRGEGDSQTSSILRVLLLFKG